jgi:hypothetical protein
MRLLIGVLLIVHGLIVAAQSTGSFKPAAGPVGLENPASVSWWPTRLGQSWLLSGIGLERSPLVGVGGVLWLMGGIALVAAGLGALGLLIPSVWWRDLAVAGAVISLIMLAIYLHPLYTIGIGADVVVLVVLLWAHWPPPELIGA